MKVKNYTYGYLKLEGTEKPLIKRLIYFIKNIF